MKELGNALNSDPSLQYFQWEQIKNDPKLSSLYAGYSRSLAGAYKDDSDAVLKKRASGEELSTDELKKENASLKTFSERFQSAERVLGNLRDKDIAELEGHLQRSLPPNLSKEGLQLYIQGLAVRSPNNFATVANQIRDWKASARSEYNERQASERMRRLKEISGQMGIQKTELNRFVIIEDTQERRDEIFAALGGNTEAVGWFARPRNAINRTFRNLGNRAPQFIQNLLRPTDRLNKMIEDYRSATGSVREGLSEVVQALEAINSPELADDPLWKEIPSLTKKTSEAKEAAEQPLTLEQAREEKSTDSIDKSFREKLRGISADAEHDWDLKRTILTTSAPDELWSNTIPGSDKTYADVLQSTTDEVDEKLKKRGFISSLVELLQNLLGNTNERAKRELLTHKRT